MRRKDQYVLNKASTYPGQHKLPGPNDEASVSCVKRVSDEEQLYSVLESNGKLINGVIAMEVWILREDSTLVQPPGGFWRSSNFNPKDRISLARIEDKNRPDYISPLPVLLGTGLVGILWNEDGPMNTRISSTFGLGLGKTMSLKNKQRSFFQKQSSLSRSYQSLTNLHSDFSQTSGRFMTRTVKEKDCTNTLGWRHINSIIQDPYQPTFQRVDLMEKSGLTKCAGIKFNISGIQGILVLFAGTDVVKHCSHDNINVSFLRAIANHVGSTIALFSYHSQLSIGNLKVNSVHEVLQSDNGGCCKWLFKYIRKLKGGTLEPPPPMPLNEALLTFIGVLVTLMALQGASTWIEDNTGYGIIMGPFGALMTLQYGLTMAPVGQPKNVLFGQVIAAIVALTISKATKNWFHRSLRISFSTATAITAKVLLGITHPPAGATALIISSGEFSSKILVSVVLSNLIAIVFSTLINNLSQKRQYPTYLRMGEGLIYSFGRSKGFDYNNHANHSSRFDIKVDKKPSRTSHSNDVKSDPCIDSNSYCDDYYHNPLHNEDNALIKQMHPSSAEVLCLDNNTPSITYNYGSMFIPPLLLPGRNDKSEFDNSASSDCSSDLEDFPL